MRAAALVGSLVALSVAVPAGAAAAQDGPNDIDFFGTKTQGGRRCEVFQPPFKGRYCPAAAATFKAHGDVLFVCDYKGDRLSAAVRGRYRGKRAWHVVGVNYWGSKRFNGCRTQNKNFRENRSVQFQVCLARFAAPGGRPIQILGRTCGPISETFNASET